MEKLHSTLISTLLAVCIFLPARVEGQGKKFACSFAHPEAHEIGYGPENITLSGACTHVIFKGFSFPQFVGRRMLFDDSEKVAFSRLVTNIRGRSNTVRVVASIGGSAMEYTLTSGTNARRRAFVQAVGTQLLLELDADAIELGWDLREEDNAQSGIATDRLSMVTLLQDLRQAVNAAGSRLEGRTRELWMRGSASTKLIASSYNVPEVCGLVEQVTLNAMNLPRGSSHAPIHGKPIVLPNVPGINGGTIQIRDGIVDAVQQWIEGGCPPKKLLLGVGLLAVGKKYASFLGQFFAQLGEDFHQWGSIDKSIVSYRELCKTFALPGWTFGWEPHGLMPFAQRTLESGQEERFSYENVSSLHHKLDLVEQRRLGGVYVDFLHSDDIDGSCGEPYALTNYMASRLRAIPSDIGFAIEWN